MRNMDRNVQLPSEFIAKRKDSGSIGKAVFNGTSIKLETPDNPSASLNTNYYDYAEFLNQCEIVAQC